MFIRQVHQDKRQLLLIYWWLYLCGSSVFSMSKTVKRLRFSSALAQLQMSGLYTDLPARLQPPSGNTPPFLEMDVSSRTQSCSDHWRILRSTPVLLGVALYWELRGRTTLWSASSLGILSCLFDCRHKHQSITVPRGKTQPQIWSFLQEPSAIENNRRKEMTLLTVMLNLGCAKHGRIWGEITSDQGAK